jgi:transcriptional regulator with XRE-family HTH domain
MATNDESPYRHFLREWRKHRGWTQEELAERCGIPKSIISRYESGERRIHIEAQFQLMAALDIRPGQFFEPPGSPWIDLEQRQSLVNMLKGTIKQEESPK